MDGSDTIKTSDDELDTGGSPVLEHDDVAEDEEGEPVVVAWAGERKFFLGFVSLVSVIALLLASLFIARLPIVSGPYLREFLQREGAARGVDIYIRSMRPKGVFDVRFEQVRLRMQRGAYVLDTNLSHLDVSPDIWESIKQRRPVPDKVTLSGAHILIERAGKSAEGNTAAKKGSGGGVGVRGLDDIDVEGKDVKVMLKAGSFATTKVFDIARINASIPLRGVPLPTRMTAYGELPDGVPFALSTKARRGDLPGSIIELKPQKPTQIEQWFSGQLPFSMAVTGLTVCSGCEEDRVALGSVDLELPNFGKGLKVYAPDASFTWKESKGFLALGEVEIKGMRSELELALDSLSMEFDPETGVQQGDLSIREGEGGQGKVALNWTWQGSQRVLNGELVSERFALGPLLELLDTKPYLHQGSLSGTANFTVDWNSALIRAETMLTFNGAVALFPLFSKELISMPLLVVDSDVLVDIRGRAVSLEHLELKLKDVKPLRLKAHIIDANQGWRFDVSALGRDIQASALLKALPEVIVEPIKGAQLKGHFGFDFSASGHSAYPESLRLNIDVDGDVEVLEDGSHADMLALKGPGYPAVSGDTQMNIPVSAEEWVDLSSLPSHVPRGLLAAEDAGFYRHNGFDFGGLARAMIHNLKVHQMQRGGSTLTQQLVKNLFLSRDRTAMRKLQEAYLTWRIESELSKSRILEMYLNFVHWGDGIYGIRNTALHYFNREPANLTVDQMSLLGTILPNPERFGGQIKRGYIASSRVEKLEHVLANLRFLGHITLDDYYFWMNRARRGKVGGLDLKVCRDDDTVSEDVISCHEI